ncbi:MAG: PilZ domain-containing protein [Betaproteobacteria bacterium]|nr:PilZ domain-containing protein [Betaproteobacteria bacterium]
MDLDAMQGVVMQASLPLRWEARADVPEFTLGGWMHANVALLEGLATLESRGTEIDIPPGEAAARAFERLEAKLDVSLMLLASVVTSHNGLPPCVPASLSAQAIEWTTQDTQPLPQQLLIHVFLSSQLPLPLRLPAELAHAEPRADGVHVRARFVQLSEPMADWLERTIFRHHRRLIQRQNRTR